MDEGMFYFVADRLARATLGRRTYLISDETLHYYAINVLREHADEVISGDLERGKITMRAWLDMAGWRKFGKDLFFGGGISDYHYNVGFLPRHYQSTLEFFRKGDV